MQKTDTAKVIVFCMQSKKRGFIFMIDIWAMNPLFFSGTTSLKKVRAYIKLINTLIVSSNQTNSIDKLGVEDFKTLLSMHLGLSHIKG